MEFVHGKLLAELLTLEQIKCDIIEIQQQKPMFTRIRFSLVGPSSVKDKNVLIVFRLSLLVSFIDDGTPHRM